MPGDAVDARDDFEVGSDQPLERKHGVPAGAEVVVEILARTDGGQR